MKDLRPDVMNVAYGAGQVAVRVAGDGPDLICLHATGHDGADFGDLAARYGDRYRVLAVDFPGHGFSDASQTVASAQSYSHCVRRVIETMCAQPPVIVGNSIGGAVAITLASEGRTRAIVLCNSGGLLAVDGKVRRITRLFSRFFAKGAHGAWWFPAAFRLYYRMVLPRAPERRREICKMARKRAGVLSEAWASFGKQAADIREEAAALKVPVLVAWAKDDKAIQLKLCLPAISRIPDHRLHLFRGGHAAFLEDRDRFYAVLDEFLKEVG